MMRSLATLLLLLPHWESIAAQCSAVFTDGASTHFSSGTISFQRDSKIIGSDGILDFSAIRDITRDDSCVTQACTLSGNIAEDLVLDPFRESSSSTDIDVDKDDTRSLAAGEYDDIDVDDRGTINFTSAGGVYVIESLKIGKDAEGNFAPGDYWIKDLKVEDRGEIKISPSGTVRIFVEDADFKKDVKINDPGDSADLALISYDDVKLDQRSTIVGVVYADDNLELKKDSGITGAVSSRSVTLKERATITYEPAAATNATLGEVCEAEATPELYANYLFEEANWVAANSVIDSSGNNRHGSAVGNAEPLVLGSCRVLDIPSNNSANQQDGIDSNVDINDVGDQGTISFWYRSNQSWSATSERQLFDASNEVPAQDKHFYLSLDSGILEFGVEDEDDNGFFLQMTSLSFPADQWVHIAVTWDVAANQLQMYVNSQGFSQVTSQTQGNFDGALGDMDTLYIGDNRSDYRVSNSTESSANGQFEDVRIYNYVRSSGEVTTESSTVPNCDDSAPDPIGHWPIDVCSLDGSANEVIDVANGNNGTSNDGASIDVDGQYCQAGDFAGTGQHINIPHVDTFEIDNGSVSFWFRTPDLSHTNDSARGGMGLFSKDSTGTDNGGYHLTIWVDNDGSVFVRHQDNSSSFDLSSAANIINENQWHHLVYTFGSGGMKLFIDSTEVGTNNSFTGGIGTNPEPIILASNAWQTADSSSPSNELRDHFRGQIDDLRLYDVQLTDSQISEINGIAEGSCDVCVVNDVLEAYWPIDVCSLDGTAGAVVDIENGYNGTSIGATASETGRFCQAGEFTGNGSHINIPNQAAFEAARGAISFWFNTPDLSYSEAVGRGGQGLFSRDSSGFDGGGHLTIWVQANGSLFVRHQSSSASSEMTSAQLVSENTWHHVVYSWGSNGMRLYLDGNEVASDSGFTVGINGNQEPIILGANAWTTGDNVSSTANLKDFFKGQIDDIRLYSNQIDDTTIGSLFSQADYACISCDISEYAFYQFEEETWSGLGSILDSGDNSRHGTPLGVTGSVIPNESLSCRVLEVPANSDENVIEGMDTRIDVNNIGNRGTISFWYLSNESWSDASSRQLFDASNAATSPEKYFYLNLESGELQFGLEDDTDDDARLAASGFNFAADTWVHIVVTWDLPGQSMQIYVNGDLVANQTNTDLRSSTLGDMDTLVIGDNRSDYFVGNSTPNSANGQFDDVRIYAEVQSKAEIDADTADVSPCTFVDHYRITHPGTALTCETASINVKACIDASCTDVYDQPSQITLTPFGLPLTIPADATNGANIDVSQTTVGSQVLSISNDSPEAENNPVCIGGPVGNTCQIEFVNAAFDIYGANVGDGIDDQVAETLFNDVNIRAVRDVDGVCVSALANETVDVTFTHSCTSPASCRTALDYGGTQIDSEATISIGFAADGTANLPSFSYADAGQISLAARATLDDGAVIESGSESILVYPQGLDISGTQATGNSDAGADFTLEIKAVGAMGGTLPNYLPGQLQFQLTSLIGPESGLLTYASGQSLSSVTTTNYRNVTINSSEFANSNGVYQFAANYSEVDQLTFDLRDSNYGGQVINNVNAALTLGLFLPAYFDATHTQAPQFANTCEATSATPVYTYFGESLGFASPAGAGVDPQFDLTARNANGAITLNYRDGYWSWLPNTSELNNITFSDAGNPTGVSLVANSATPSASDINNSGVEYGRQRLSISGMRVIYQKPALPIEPISSNAAMILPAALLTDANYGGNLICVVSSYDKSNPGACESVSVNSISGADLRWGRILMGNAFGPENEDLLVTVKTEYFLGNTFIRNRDDQCTSFNWAASDFSKQDRSVEIGYSDITGETTVSGSFTLLSGISQGLDGINVTAPTNGERGEMLIELLPDGVWDSYLQFDWNVDEVGIQNPSATVTFGQFRGNERVIHWREVF